jgi:DNA mismatch repair protein MutL
MSEYPSIQLLSDHVANKIAAGEVVDRPASVVKELMENALDAHACEITVEVVDGGKKLVAVQDNGVGMTRDDMLLSVERHATSKIREVDDIEAVDTMGFRGEALAAIASVSRFSITSRRSDELSGHELTMYGGKLQDVTEMGCPTGTRIAVRNLFFNVPARRKFLRADATELSHIRQIFLTIALAHHGVSFRLVVDEKEVLNLPAGTELAERLRMMYSADLVARLCPLHLEADACRISGLISSAGLSRADRVDQYFFVNRRPASSGAIYAAIREGFKGRLPKDRHPILFLFLDLDPGQVDVNVHPTKKEVRLRQPGQVHDALVRAIDDAFSLSADRGELPSNPQSDLIPSAPPEPAVRIDDLPELPVMKYPRWTQPEGDSTAPPQPFTPDPAAQTPDMSASAAGPLSWCRILGQVGGLYVALETEGGLVTMNPQAAYERVLYERLLKDLAAGQMESQGLLTPETVKLSPKDADAIRQALDALQASGVGVSDFGGDVFMVDALPSALGSAGAQDVLEELVAEFAQSGKKKPDTDWLREHIAMASSRAAVRGKTSFSTRELETLVQDLARCEMPYTSPRGHPTLILTSLRELNRKFGVKS